VSGEMFGVKTTLFTLGICEIKVKVAQNINSQV
jgi:hypothetical protein